MAGQGRGARRPRLTEKFSLLLESRGLADEELGSWLRQNGLHSEHLSVWEREVLAQVRHSEG